VWKGSFKDMHVHAALFHQGTGTSWAVIRRGFVLSNGAPPSQSPDPVLLAFSTDLTHSGIKEIQLRGVAMVTYPCNPSYSQGGGQADLRPAQANTCDPSYKGGVGWRITGKGLSPGKNRRSYPKKFKKQKTAGGMILMVK
jgi:hypothetical protein